MNDTASMNDRVTITPATPEDVPVVYGFVRKIAAYEKLSHEVVATQEDFREALFGPVPRAETVLACRDGEPVGFALFFHNFSTFTGKAGLYLEDLFVDPEYRGRGIGKALLAHLAGIARQRGCPRFEWTVLNWNTPAIEFYKSLGAVPMDEWTVCRLSGDALTAMAAKADVTLKTDTGT